MRSVNGESDGYFGGDMSGVRAQLQVVNGVSCPTATSCLQTAGNGWYIIPNGQVSDGKADHCYFLSGADITCASYSGVDSKWSTGTAAWSLQPNLTWLASRVGL